MITAIRVLFVVTAAAPASAAVPPEHVQPSATGMAAAVAVAPASATLAAGPIAADLQPSATTAALAVPASALATPVSATGSVTPEGWSPADLDALRCRLARHERERDEGFTFSEWWSSTTCPRMEWNSPAGAAWDRYLKRARRFDDCVTGRRTRKSRAFFKGGVLGGLVTGAAFGIARSGNDTVRLTSVVSAALAGGGVLWWLERRKPDPPCGAPPATEWPQ